MRSLDKDPLGINLLLDLPMLEGTGTALTQDVAKPHHPVTLASAPTWTTLASGIQVLDLNSADPDYLSCLAASCTDLDFTTEDFSGVIWVYPDAVAAANYFFLCRALAGTDGWTFYHNTDLKIAFNTTSAGPAQVNTLGTASKLVATTWQLLGFSRDGTAAKLYYNGADDTATAGAHADPITANRNLYVGIYNGAAAGWFDGKIWRPRIWERALTPAEHRAIFNRERHLFGV